MAFYFLCSSNHLYGLNQLLGCVQRLNGGGKKNLFGNEDAVNCLGRLDDHRCSERKGVIFSFHEGVSG